MLEIVKEPKHWAANDPINRHLGVLASRSGWTEASDRARYALEAELKSRGFIEFDGTPQHYGLWVSTWSIRSQRTGKGIWQFFVGKGSRCFVPVRAITGAGTLLGPSISNSKKH